MAKKKYILTLDQGTSSSRAILFNHHQEIAAIEQRETSQLYPQPGWVEQSPEEIWDSQAGVVQLLLRKNRIDAREIAAIGITNQRETTILWDKTTGRPIYNAIIWQDKRTADYCRQVKNSVHSDYITKTTGLIIDSYFSASKIKWILDHVPDARGLAEKGDLLFGTVDTWLIWKLTSGRVHATDTSNASRTLLFNIHTLDWDARLLEIFDIPAAIMPKVVDSSGIVATTRKFDGIEIPLAGIAGDQQAALFGQCCFEPGMIKNTYGTGCFMLMNTGEKPVGSTSGLLTTVAWSINGKTQYALEGSVFIAGAAIKWLRDSLGVISSAAETEAIAQSVESNEGVYFVPAFSGLGAPYWDMYARGTITGLSQGTGFRHIVRATLEALAYQTRDVIEAMVAGSGISLRSLNVDGGAVANNFLLQFQSDLLNCEVLRPEIIETTALGAAFLAGLATGFWQNEDLSINRRIERKFTPSMSVVEREMLYDGWKKAVSRARGNL